ncbi:MAG TPA: TIGR03435 family protein [Candidatus Acidoferrales bacterium]|nr:TIGR03435 family protein [Candidatus Acidoferrales bacterium]
MASSILAALAIGSTAARDALAQDLKQVSAQPQLQLKAWDEQYAAFVYDVVSIKPFKSNPRDNGRSLGTMQTPDGYIADFPVIGLIDEAFRIDLAHGKVSANAAWLTADYYDIRAKMSPEVLQALQNLTPRDRYLARKHMLRVLLQDRFRVTVHFENQEVAAFNLVVAKNGLKLKNAAVPNPSAADFTRKISGNVFTITAKSQPASAVIGLLQADTGRQVYDNTGLTGLYDFTLIYTPSQILNEADLRPDASPLTGAAQPPAKAIEEQLGLHLVSSTGQMQVVVVDHAERPSEN